MRESTWHTSKSSKQCNAHLNMTHKNLQSHKEFCSQIFEVWVPSFNQNICHPFTSSFAKYRMIPEGVKYTTTQTKNDIAI